MSHIETLTEMLRETEHIHKATLDGKPEVAAALNEYREFAEAGFRRIEEQLESARKDSERLDALLALLNAHGLSMTLAMKLGMPSPVTREAIDAAMKGDNETSNKIHI